MTATVSYEERLEAFARGRALVRLTPAVVNRRGALCDACGSHQPRVLHALRDRASGRHHFVGQSCLEALAGRGSVGRRAVRARTDEAYEAEFDLRRGEARPPDQVGPAADAAAGESRTGAAVEPDGAMLLVAILRPGQWTSLLESVGADRDACLVVPLGHQPPSLAGVALPLDRIHEFVRRADAAHSTRAD